MIRIQRTCRHGGRASIVIHWRHGVVMVLLEGKTVIQSVRNFIPPLVYASHKGQCGRIGIVGGSKEYTGAPYFAGISALLSGADLSHIVCPEAAASAIKSYSPELIVHPTLSSLAEDSYEFIDRMHAVVIGPGLGREENLTNAEKIVRYCREKQKPLVIDADGLFLITRNPELIQGYPGVILTPNVVEFDRLYRRVFGETQAPSDEPEETTKLCQKLGNVTIVRKGPVDVISDANHLVLCRDTGSPRRCGGQGDLLSGSMGVLFYWCLQDKWKESYSASVAAGYAACCLTRQCAKQAFEKFGRATVTGNLIDEIGVAFSKTFET